MPGPKRPKCKDWERDRRERLNQSFYELSRLLPDHDPTLPLSKLDIITKATSYIKHLQEQNMKLMENSENNDTYIKEVLELKQRISDLLRRTRQLAELLQAANIPVPTVPPADDFEGPMKKPMKWSGRLRQDAPKECFDDIQKRKEEREKQKKERQLINKAKMKSKSILIKKKAKKCANTSLPVVNSCFVKDKNMSAVPQVLNVDLNLSSHLNTSNVSTPLREINNPLPPNKVANCVTAYSKTITLPCTTTVSIVISNTKPDQIVSVAKSNILTAPIMATGIQPVLERNPGLSSLGPGTLILPDGRIVPVPGIQTQTVLQAPTQYIVNRPVNQPAVIVMQNIGTTLKPSLPQKSQRLLIPKPKCKDSTKTTYVNKLPIPAISTQQRALVGVNKNSSLIISNSVSTTKTFKLKCENRNVNKKPQVKKVKAKSAKIKQKSSAVNLNHIKVSSKETFKTNKIEKVKTNSKNSVASISSKNSVSERNKNERRDGSNLKRTKNSSDDFVSKRVKATPQTCEVTENNKEMNSSDKLEEDSGRNSDIIDTSMLKSNNDIQAENTNKTEHSKQKDQSKESEIEDSSKSSILECEHNDNNNFVNRTSNSENCISNSICSYKNNNSTIETSEQSDSCIHSVHKEPDKSEGEKLVVDEQVCHNQQQEVGNQIIINEEGEVKSNNNELNKSLIESNPIVKISDRLENNAETANHISNTDKVHDNHFPNNNESHVSSLIPGTGSNTQNCCSEFPANVSHHTGLVSLNDNVNQVTSKPSEVANIDKTVGLSINSGLRIGDSCSIQYHNQLQDTGKQIINEESGVKSNNSELNKHRLDGNSTIKTFVPLQNNDQTVSCASNTDRVHDDCFSNSNKASSVKIGVDNSFPNINKSSVKIDVSSLISGTETNKQHYCSAYPLNINHQTSFISVNENLNQVTSKPLEEVANIDKSVSVGRNSGISVSTSCSVQDTAKQIVVVNEGSGVKSNNNELNKHIIHKNSTVKIPVPLQNNSQTVRYISNKDRVHDDCFSNNGKASVKVGVSSLVSGTESNKRNSCSTFPINVSHHTDFILLNDSLNQVTSKPSEVANVDKTVGVAVTSGVSVDTSCSMQCHNQQQETGRQTTVLNEDSRMKTSNELKKHMNDNNTPIKIPVSLQNNDQTVDCVINMNRVHDDSFLNNNKAAVKGGISDCFPNNNKSSVKVGVSSFESNIESNKHSSCLAFPINVSHHTGVRNTDFISLNESLNQVTSKPSEVGNSDKTVVGTNSGMNIGISCNMQETASQAAALNEETGVRSNNNGLNKHMINNNSTIKMSGSLQNDDQTVSKTDKVHDDYFSNNNKSSFKVSINDYFPNSNKLSVKVGAGSLVSGTEGNKQTCCLPFPSNASHRTNFILLNDNINQVTSKPSEIANVDKTVGLAINSGGRMGTSCNIQASNSVTTGSNTDPPLSTVRANTTVEPASLALSGDKNTGQQLSATRDGNKNTCLVSDSIQSYKHPFPATGILQNTNQLANFGTSEIANGSSRTVVSHPGKNTRHYTELSNRSKDGIKESNSSGQFNNILSVDKNIMQQNAYVDTGRSQVSSLMTGQGVAQSDKISQQVTSTTDTDKSSQISVNSQIANLQFDKVPKQIDHTNKLTQASNLMKMDNTVHSSANLNCNKGNGQIINLTSADKMNNNQMSHETDTTHKIHMYQENIFRDSTQNRDRNLFIPVNHSCMDDMRLSLPHSEFSNDLFTSLQVPSTGQHPESISPTAAFLLAFPLVSTSKTSEMLVDNDNSDSQHATPTTILQIGNIDPPGTELYHPASPIIMDSSINTFHNLKPKNSGNKNSVNTKQHTKGVETFDRYQQQFDINERYQDNFQGNQNFSHNHTANETNCKQRKVNFVLNQEQEMYTECNKKKNNDRICPYMGQANSEICGYPEKSYERLEFHQNENISQETSQSDNQKKSSALPLLNSSGVQNTYTQPSYSLFSSSSDYPLSISSQYTTTQPTIETTKSLQPPNFSILPWTCSTTASSSLNHNDYVPLYTSFPQSIHNKNQNFSTTIKNNSQKSQTCDSRIKDKSVTTGSSKFPANFQFTDQSAPRQQQDGTSSQFQTNDVVSTFKVDNKNKKSKTVPRPPVNWMTAPDIRPVLTDHTATPIIPDVMFPPQKDIDFSMPQTNSVLNSCSNIPSFNISTSISNTPQTFYSNSHFSGLDIPLDLPPLPEITTNTSKSHRSLNNASNNHNYSWSPSKSTMPSLLPHIDNHSLMIPSTLPTLVGDLALGTNTGPSTPAENSLKNFNLPNTFSQTNENTNKKYESRQQEPRKVQGKSPERDCLTVSNSDRRNSNRTMPDYCNKTHSHQSTNTSGSFLSVSQLVDHAKSEGRNISRRVNKQSQTNKQTLQKRNSNVQQQTDKQSTVNKNGNSVNYSATSSMNNVQRKTDINYSDDRNMGITFSGSFPAPNHVPPSTGLWNSNEKSARNAAGGQYKGGSYSAESLIGVNQEQDNITEIPGSFSMTNQYNSHYSQPQKPYIDSSVVCSTNNYTSDFSHQNIQHSDFSHQQAQHTYQNCFNFSNQNSIYTSTNTAPFISENDYQLSLDPSYVFHHPVSNVNKSHNQACQTTSNTKDTHRQIAHSNNSKRNSTNNKRRDDYSSMGTNQATPFLQSTDIYQPPHYSNTCRSAMSSSYQPVPCITSSPPHHGTTTLTNFNLSTIFPEINDKRAVSGGNTFHSNNKHTDSSTTLVQSSVRNEFVPPTDSINTQLPPIRTEFNNILSTQQPVVSLNQSVPTSHFTVEGFSNIPPPFQVHH